MAFEYLGGIFYNFLPLSLSPFSLPSPFFPFLPSHSSVFLSLFLSVFLSSFFPSSIPVLGMKSRALASASQVPCH